MTRNGHLSFVDVGMVTLFKGAHCSNKYFMTKIFEKINSELFLFFSILVYFPLPFFVGCVDRNMDTADKAPSNPLPALR